jgi:hypothetical protein
MTTHQILERIGQYFGRTSGLILVSVLLSCARSEGDDINNEGLRAERRLTSLPSLAQVGLQHRVRSRAEIAHHAARLGGILRNGTGPLAGVDSDANGAPRIDGSMHFRLTMHSSIAVSYREDTDDLSVQDEAVRIDHTSPVDIGRKAALTRFNAALDSVIAGGIIQHSELDRTAIVNSTLLASEAAPGAPVMTRIMEYEFTVPKVWGGVRVHEAGVTISVHRSGALARIKVFGPSFTGMQGGPRTALVDQSAADARLAASYPSAKVEPLGLTYWLPPGQGKETSLVAEPQYRYLVYQRLPAVQDGKNLLSMGIIVSVSALDQNAKPIAWQENTPRKMQPDLKP